MTAPDPRRVSAASKRFQTFFEELKLAFVERDDLLAQIALALLAREHVLMTGPPGTAKSQVASAVLRRIIDEQTGLPSVYARQFTESTVQTDLVGPINFKTLMDTGRTEHFTDQGILGAVHAFLDEVFDGRDMLLRSALNVLHERELKEGTKTTRGAIECALMTSNRYLAEILEGSRDTLLAFVDRIAFVGFMPRAFADPKNLATVLRRHVGGAGNVTFAQPLTVQDLDALQATVDSVHVSDAACDAIASFLERLELELAAAAKADATFIPTRYISTRTAVRCGRVLRAIVVFDRIFAQPGRPLEVLPEDFARLRLHLLLSGPSREGVDKLLARETDPRERRQLMIVRTERDAFERCLGKVPQFSPSPRVPPPEVASLERAASDALGSADPAKLVSSVQALTPLALAGGPTADRAASLVKQMADSLVARALRLGLTAGRDPEAANITATAEELADLANKVEQSSGPQTPDARALGRWLRGRAIALLDEAIAFEPGARAADVGALLESSEKGEPIALRIARRIGQVEALATLRSKLESDGAEQRDPVASQRALRVAFERVEEDIAGLLDAGFRHSVAQVLLQADGTDIDRVIAGLGTVLGSLDTLAGRLTASSGQRSRLKERVVGPRIGSLIAAVVTGLDARDRQGLLGKIDALKTTLEKSDLSDAIAPEQWLEWSANALVRAEGEVVAAAPTYEGYRALRAAEQRSPVALSLRDIAVRVAPPIRGTAEEAERALVELLGRVPDGLRREAAAADIARVERAIELLEQWWWGLTSRTDPKEPLDDAPERLQSLVSSRFLNVVLDEAALLRFALEAKVIAETFPTESERAMALRARVDELRAAVRRHVAALGQMTGNQAWGEVLDRSGKRSRKT